MANQEIRVLVVDDEEPARRLLKKELGRKGFSVETAGDGASALKAIKGGVFDVVLMDIVMPGISGLDVMKVMESGPLRPEVIVLTGQATVDTAVEAMKSGAYDYLSKPYKTDELVLLINRAYEHARLARENRMLNQELTRTKESTDLVGASAAFMKMLSLVEKAAPSDAAVLIQGESGTGKELVANTIWRMSRRKDGRFIALNCASLSESLLESELFGHEKGAFTSAFQMKNGLVEVADGGTLFLDEIADMPTSLQAKLLRFLDSGEFRRVGSNANLKVDVRLIAATNRDLAGLMKSGGFREDLYYRLNVVSINIPPLRERKDDIPALAEHFLVKYAKASGKRIKGFAEQSMDMLLSYPWPGNARELENVVERAVILSERERITPEDLSLMTPPAPVPEDGRTLQDMERRHIERVLKETGGNQRAASEILGVDRKTLYLKLKRYNHEKGK